MTIRSKQHLTLVHSTNEHALLTEFYDGDVADVVCICGEQWNRVPTVFLEELSDYHCGAMYR